MKARDDERSALRIRAEAVLAGREESAEPDGREMKDLLHELLVYQTELEMQNDELRRARAEIEASRNRYIDLFDFAPVGYLTLDERGIITDANLSGSVLLGTEKRSLVGAPLSAYVAPEYHSRMFSHLRAVVSDGTRQTCELRMEKPDKTGLAVLLESMRVADATDAPLIRCAVIDITARKKAERERGMLAEAVESLVDGVIIMSVEGNILYTNPAFLRLCGHQKDAILEKECRVVAGGLCGNDLYGFIKNALATGEYSSTRLTDIVADNGTVTYEASASPIKDELGDVGRWVIVVHDVSARVTMERRLAQAQKMEALGTLSGGIAHDFNNTLAAMIGFTELVKDDLPAGSREEHHLERVLEAGLRGRELIKQMLTFTRKSDHEKRPFRLSPVIQETLGLVRAATPSTIAIKLDIASKSGVILGDPVQIQQVLMNLCTNATHAMGDRGGTLGIELSDFRVSPSHKKADNMEPGPYLKLTVRDTGAGMTPDIVDKIFDPFFTTKRPGEGTGLGLSVVMGIVKQYRGYITVRSEPGHGSVFTVCFPKITGEAAAGVAVGDEPVPTGSERILFVDDEEFLAEMGERLISGLGYQVTARTSSNDAPALLKDDPFRFDLVITDQTMPDMTGLELAREVLAIRPDVPVIMCSGFSHVVDADGAKAAGIRAFAMKPLTKGEIARVIRKVLDG
jgi:PAS domain S-box-containing protein